MKLSNEFKPTETFFDNHNGEIVVITRVDDEKEMIYGKYCTGPHSKGVFENQEYAFRPRHDIRLP